MLPSRKPGYVCQPRIPCAKAPLLLSPCTFDRGSANGAARQRPPKPLEEMIKVSASTISFFI